MTLDTAEVPRVGIQGQHTHSSLSDVEQWKVIYHDCKYPLVGNDLVVSFSSWQRTVPWSHGPENLCVTQIPNFARDCTRAQAGQVIGP